MASKKQKSKKVGETKIKAAAAPKSIKKHARGGKGNKNKPKASVTPKTRRSARLAFAAEEVVHPVSQKKIEAKITKAQPFRSIFDIKLPAPAVLTTPVKDPIKSAAVKRSHKQPAKITKPVQNKKPNVERESRKRFAGKPFAPEAPKTFGYDGGSPDYLRNDRVWFYDEKLSIYRRWFIGPDGGLTESFHILPPAKVLKEWETLLKVNSLTYPPPNYAVYKDKSGNIGTVKLPIVIVHCWRANKMCKLPVKTHIPFNLDAHRSQISEKDITDPCIYIPHEVVAKRRKQKLALVNDTDPRGFPKCISRTPMPASPDDKRLTKPRSWDAAFKSLGWYHPKDNYTFYPVPEGYSLTLRRPFGISGTELEQWHEDAENGPLAGLAIAVRAYGPEKRKYRVIQKPRTLPKFGESSRTLPKSGEPSETLPKFSEPKFGEPRFGEPSTIWPTKKIQTRSQTSPLPFTRSKRRTASAMNSPSERFYTIRKYSDAGDISPE
ncbi:hypothetical protein D6C85_03704 [Aureobasidium pullulans]|uniref:Uncharacterized protein n=1 Tax=Aureobasidium pullulans TaxID=5580 RepID=A0A4S9X6Y6_AURPU|nr:hypothetical protein D6C85_03704 [Aureobasidium pullulans]